MRTKSDIRFDLRAIKDLVDDKTFARGERYHRDGLVTIISIRPERLVAQVSGTEDYRTELIGSGTTVGGTCTCRAYQDYGFCKHMVAVALAANAACDSGPEDEVVPLDRIRDHLRTKDVDALVDMIAEMAERDPALFRRLDLAAASMQADDKTLEVRLRKAIDGTTRTRDYIAYADVPDWAEGVNEALDALEAIASGGRAPLALRLAEYAMRRVEKAMEAIDDSDGHGGAMLERVRDIHLAACTAAAPDPVKLARDLFDRQRREIYDIFYDAPALYADVLGEQGLAEYRRLAEDAWRKLPARMGRRRGAADDTDMDRDRLMSVLDFFAERDGDVETQIALRARDLSSPWRYLQLAQFCLDHGRPDEAQRRAEEGLWVFEDEQSTQGLTFFVAELLAKNGRKDEAVAHLWRLFEKDPGFDLYKRLAGLGGPDARTRAIGLLETRLAAPKRPARSHWSWDRPGDLLVGILTEEKAFDEAWAAARKYDITLEVQETLARASDKTHAREALAIYAARVEQLVDRGQYDEAAKLVTRMAGLRDAAEQAAYLADIKERYRRRRNFMKLLS